MGRFCAAALLAVAGGAFSAPHVAAQSLDPGSDEEHRCMALSLYWEARSEGVQGMVAVGSVVLNRLESEDFPRTVCAVVYDGGETPPCQFSWWCDGRSDVPRDEQMWKMALEVADRLLTNAPEDPTRGALFFHSADIEVPWTATRTRTVEILGHVYYR